MIAKLQEKNAQTITIYSAPNFSYFLPRYKKLLPDPGGLIGV
jgi:hypothetical protein